MDDRKYTQISFLIVVTIVLTILIQGFWNQKNYLRNKQIFINNVQASLDNALDTYYANLVAKHKFPSTKVIHKKVMFDSLHNGALDPKIVESFVGNNVEVFF